MYIHRVCAYTVLGSIPMNDLRAHPPEMPCIGLRPNPPPLKPTTTVAAP